MTLPFKTARISPQPLKRRSFTGGSDARIIMGSDEAALLRLWREKRGEPEPEDLSGNLIVQLGLVTEPLNRHWFERNTGHLITQVQRRGPHPGTHRRGGSTPARGAENSAASLCPRLIPSSC